MAERRNWTEEEVRAALALYLVTEFGRLHSRNPDIVRLSQRLGRTASAVALKLTNLAALDASLPRHGMAHASATDRRVWQAFLADPKQVEESYARMLEPPPAPGFAEELAAFAARGGERMAATRERIGQDLFRRSILTSYRGRCALTGIEDERLLIASHIVGWAEAPGQRMWPTNGICLNALHDKAFDRHLITFDGEYRMVLSPRLPEKARAALLRGTEGQLHLPDRFWPDEALMARHRAAFEAAA